MILSKAIVIGTIFILLASNDLVIGTQLKCIENYLVFIYLPLNIIMVIN